MRTTTQERSSQSLNLTECIFAMACGGVALLDSVGATQSELTAFADTVAPHTKPLREHLPPLAVLPIGLKRVVTEISRTLYASNMVGDLISCPPLLSAERKSSHTDFLNGPIVATLIVPIRGEDARFAYGDTPFLYPYEACLPGVQEFTYGVGRAALVRQMAFKIVAEDTSATTNLAPKQHGGWNVSSDRLLLTVDFYSTEPQVLDQHHFKID